MRRAIYLAFCLALILSNSTGILGAVEVEIIGGINYLTYDPDLRDAYSNRISPAPPAGPENTGETLIFKNIYRNETTNPDNTEQEIDKNMFNPYLCILGNIRIKTDISSSSAFIFNLTRDNIFHNSLDFRLATKADYFSFEFGPFIGMTDNLEKPFMGFIGSLEFAYPGIIVAALNASSTLGSQYGLTGDHTREELGASVGFWLPFMIPSISGTIKNFTRNIDDYTSIRDSLSKLWVSFEFYGKNSPAVFRIDAGYQWFERKYDCYSSITDDDTGETIIANLNEINDTDNLNMFFAGLEVRWQVSNTVKLILSGEIPLFVTPAEPMKAPAFYKMPKITAGFSYAPMK